MNKTIGQAIMKRTRLEKNYLKNDGLHFADKFTVCVSIARKAKWDCYNKLGHKKMTER